MKKLMKDFMFNNVLVFSLRKLDFISVYVYICTLRAERRKLQEFFVRISELRVLFQCYSFFPEFLYMIFSIFCTKMCENS